MGYVERKLKSIVWDTPGNKAVGRLVRVTKTKFDDGGTGLKYYLKDAQNGIIEIKGATSLNAKIHAEDMGCNMSIEYLGEDDTRQMSANRSKPKLFKVLVDADSKQEVAPGSYMASDEDIPF